MVDYDRIPVKKSMMIPNKLNRLFPNANYTEALLKLIESYSSIGSELGRKAIWVDKETYNDLNRMGKVEDDFDDVINKLIKFRKGTY